MKPQKHKNFVTLLEKAESIKARSERHLAKLVGATNTDIRRWKSGKGSPDIEVHERLASLLDTDMNGLIAELNKDVEEEEDIGSSGEVGGLKRKLGTRLIAIANELTTIAKELLGAEMNPHRIKDMVSQCLENKTEADLKRQIEKYNNIKREFSVNLETIRAIAEGKRKIRDKYETGAISEIVDPEGRFTIDQWLEAASIESYETEEIDEFENNHHINQHT